MYKVTHNNIQGGFTLIELLVVIAIIGMLSSVVLASLNSARVKARDAKRKSDLKQLQLALEFYYDTNNAYPSGGAGSDQSWWANNTGSGILTPLVANGLIPSLPHDPGKNAYVGSGCGGAQFYAYWSDGQDYLLGAVEETKGGSGCTQTGNWGGKTNTNYTYQFYIKNY